MIFLDDVTRDSDPVMSQKCDEGWTSLHSRTDLGFLKLPSRDDLWSESKRRAEEVRKSFDRCGVIGIGGSSLGTRALVDSLGDLLDREVEFFENVDAKSFWRKLNALSDLQKMHWVIISKSGSTMESLAQAQFVSEFLDEKGIALSKVCTVITEERENPLFKWAVENEVEILEIPQDVGGRFSVLSPVGLFPLAFAGLNIDQFKSGANWALEQRELTVELCSQALTSFRFEEWVTLFWFYSDDLSSFGDWLQQLWAESLAKKVCRGAGEKAPRVSTPVPLIGANDQHSVLQQVVEGADDKFIWFFRVPEAENFGPELKAPIFESQKYMKGRRLGHLLQVEAISTRDAAYDSGVNSLTLVLEKIDVPSIGAFVMLFEICIGVLGEVLNINAFDQPGVESGKKLAKSALIE